MGFYHKWEDFPEITAPYLMEKLGMSPVGRVMSGEKIMVSLVKGPKGIPPLMHHHEAEQIVIFFKGKMKCIMKNVPPRILGPGEIWVVPSMVPHGGEILEDSEYIEVCSPPRLDMLGGYTVSHTFIDQE